jgi:hypothetical protein
VSESDADGPDVADFIDESPSFQRREWVVNRVGWVVIALIVTAGLAGVWGDGLASRAQVTSVDGRLRVDYERFVRNLGEATLQVSFARGSARDGAFRLALSQQYLSEHEVMATTPEPDMITVAGGQLVYEFPGRGDSALTVTFDLRPTSGPGVLDAVVGDVSGPPVRFRQFVYP